MSPIASTIVCIAWSWVGFSLGWFIRSLKAAEDKRAEDFANTRDVDIPRVCRTCGLPFAGEAMRYCLALEPRCPNAIWTDVGVRSQGQDWHMGGRP